MKERSETRRGSPLLGIAIIVASFALGGYLWVQHEASMQKERIAYLEGLSERLRSETVPLKFMILSRSEGAIKAKVKLYDLAGREVAAVEKSWPGSRLYVDILLIPVRGEKEAKGADSWLAFPYRIFTDELAAASGSLLFEAYDEGGFPEVLKGTAWSAKEEAAIRTSFARAQRLAKGNLPATDAVKGAFGSAVHEAVGLSSFEEGVVYKVLCRVKGGVEIMEE
jgi:hypothetical protein